MEIYKLLEKLSEALGETQITEEKKDNKGSVGTRVTLNSLEPMKGTIIRDTYIHRETGKDCRDVKLDDGRIVQVYNGQFTMDAPLKEDIMTTGDKVAQACREALAAMDIIEDYAELNEEETKLVAEVRYLFSNMVPELQ